MRDKISTANIERLSRLKFIFRSVGIWVRKNKLLTFVIIIVLIIALEYHSLPNRSEIVQLRRMNPRVTALMDQRKDEARDKGKKYFIKQVWIPLSQMNNNIKHAVITAEDGTFYEHEGIDWFELKESIKKDIRKWKFVRGASTITQQLAKNLYLSTSKDPVRKLKEIIIATALEDELSKNRILELYLNIVEWGDGIFGIEAASLAYFGKHASDISREEASRLAAVLPSPLRHKPNDNNRYVTYRKKIIMARLDARGW